MSRDMYNAPVFCARIATVKRSSRCSAGNIGRVQRSTSAQVVYARKRAMKTCVRCLRHDVTSYAATTLPSTCPDSRSFFVFAAISLSDTIPTSRSLRSKTSRRCTKSLCIMRAASVIASSSWHHHDSSLQAFDIGRQKPGYHGTANGSISVGADKNISWQGPTDSTVYVQVDNDAPVLLAFGASGMEQAP